MPEEAIKAPFARLSAYDLSTIFRALCNAALAVEHFTNRNNYGPAIQQLILALGEVCENHIPDGSYDLPKLNEVLSKIIDGMDGDDFEGDNDVDIKNGFIHLWEHKISTDERLQYYKDRYPWTYREEDDAPRESDADVAEPVK